MMSSKASSDLIAGILNSLGQFKGKARLANFLGRLSYSLKGGHGTFSPAGGVIVTIDLGDRIQRLMWGGAYEPHVTRCLVALLRPGDTFVDVGAHIGFFSMVASSLVGSSGKVYAFEANSTLFQTLHLNALQFPWLVASLRAVCNESGSVNFSTPQHVGESGWGKLTSVRNEGHFESVMAITLDDWHKSVHCPPIRLVKIDAEGSEPLILEGARCVLRSTRPHLIVELNDELLCEGGRTRESVADTLREQGYRIFAIGLDGLEECTNLNDPSFAEILCVPSDRLDEIVKLLPRYRLPLISADGIDR